MNSFTLIIVRISFALLTSKMEGVCLPLKSFVPLHYGEWGIERSAIAPVPFSPLAHVRKECIFGCSKPGIVRECDFVRPVYKDRTAITVIGLIAATVAAKSLKHRFGRENE